MLCFSKRRASEWAVPSIWTLRVKQFIWNHNVASKDKLRQLLGSLPGFDMATTVSLDLTTWCGGWTFLMILVHMAMVKLNALRDTQSWASSKY